MLGTLSLSKRQPLSLRPFFQVRCPVSRAPARDAGEVGAIPTHLTSLRSRSYGSASHVTEDKLAESPACRAGDSGGSTRRSRHFLSVRKHSSATGPPHAEPIGPSAKSASQSDHERHFGRIVQQRGPLSYTEEITVRIRACPPLSGSSTAERPSVKRQDVGANPTLTANFVGE